jgi:hypothetical protein
MSAEPMHGLILGGPLLAANAILFGKSGCKTTAAGYFSGPRTLMRRVDLPTWLRLIRGLISE